MRAAWRGSEREDDPVWMPVRTWVRRVCYVSVITAASVVATAQPASAHGSAGQAATNWRSDVTGFTLPDPGAKAVTTDLGDHIQVTADGTRQIIVFGYNQEPYLKFDTQGVSINSRSPAGFLNRSATASKKVPSRFDTKVAPEWRKLSAGHTYRWHDHRIHRGPGGAARPWTIPISVDGVAATINGQLVYIAADTPTAALLVGVLALGIFVAFAMLRPRAMTIVSGLVVLACSGAILVSQHQASTEPWKQQLGATLYSLGTMLSAGAIVVVALGHRRSLTAPVELLAGVAILVCGGFARIDWLTHSQLPSSMSFGFATTFVILPSVIATILAVLAIIDLMKPANVARPSRA